MMLAILKPLIKTIYFHSQSFRIAVVVAQDKFRLLSKEVE